MIGLLCGDDGSVTRKHEVDAWVRYEVGLKLGDVNIECSVVSQPGCERRDDLSQETIEVGLRWTLNVQIPAADVVERLVVHHDGHVRMLQ